MVQEGLVLCLVFGGRLPPSDKRGLTGNAHPRHLPFSLSHLGQFNWESALSLLRQWSSERSDGGGRWCLWLLATQLAQLMRQVFTLAPPNPSMCDTMVRICKSLLSEANYPLGYVSRPLFTEFHVAFVEFCQTVDSPAIDGGSGCSVGLRNLIGPIGGQGGCTLGTHLLTSGSQVRFNSVEYFPVLVCQNSDVPVKSSIRTLHATKSVYALRKHSLPDCLKISSSCGSLYNDHG
ncbi:unnamed protein product [Dibothriocephalus latus]|uniref:Uncharacterized protein n=1 Tax=Dibothriocephalus latus TaxID=60516 RepID=A0A3P7MYM4_DIBLA|nr:unnamed protein product [Dibothriocephalus latus]